MNRIIKELNKGHLFNCEYGEVFCKENYFNMESLESQGIEYKMYDVLLYIAVVREKGYGFLIQFIALL